MIIQDELFLDCFINNRDIDLNKMMPPLNRNKIEKPFHEALNIEFRLLQEAYMNVLSQLFLTRATYKLDEWERLAGIDTNENINDEIRRSNIIAAFRSLGVTKAERIKSICRSYSNGEVNVIEQSSKYHYIIEFISEIGIPQRIGLIRKIIDAINPAHLTYEFSFKYNTWGDLRRTGKTLKELKESGKTIKQLREEVLNW